MRLSHIFFGLAFGGRMQWLRLFLAVSLGALLGGCEPGTFCSKCMKAESCKQCPAPKPPVKVDWTGLSEELKKVEFGGDVTINVEAAEFDLKPGEEVWKVEIGNWGELTGQLQGIVTANTAQAEYYALVQQLNAMLADRQPPATYNYWIWGSPASEIPPVDLCPIALPVFLFFPQEANFEAWKNGEYADCSPESDCWTNPEEKCDDTAAPICPNRALYGDYVEKFVASLANCESGVKTLRVRGFASSSKVREPVSDPEKLQTAFEIRTVPSSCERPEHTDPQKFNLLMAEARARNVANLLRSAVGHTGDITVETEVWCRYKDMETARKVIDNEDGPYDSFKGMLNRRAEIVVE